MVGIMLQLHYNNLQLKLIFFGGFVDMVQLQVVLSNLLHLPLLTKVHSSSPPSPSLVVSVQLPGLLKC